MKIRRDLVRIWLLCAAMLPAVAQTQFTFVTNNGAITITGYTGSGGVVVIPDTTNGWPVTSIGDEAFYQCTNLNSVTIPGSVTNIGHGAFAFCGNLASVTIPDSVTSIGICAFLNCTNLNTATVSTNITGIGVSDFDSCTSLTNVTIPNGITNIGSSAFQNCAGLASVTIPASVASIGQCAFGSCDSLQAITVDPQNTNYSSLDGILLNLNQTWLIQYPGGKAGKYTIPNSVSQIGSFAFDSCAGLTGVVISNYNVSIGNWAFVGCSGLISATLQQSIYTIGSYAFESCSSLKSFSVTIFSTVTPIVYHLFDGCTNLTDVAIFHVFLSPFDLSRFFSDCSNLTSIYLRGINPSYVWNPTNQIATPTAYYLPWANPSSISNLPTALWLPRVQIGDASFGVHTNQFGFNINWAGGVTMVVEACADLANPVWTPLGTNTITGTLASGSIYFSDPQWTNYPGRFYRIRGINASQQ